MEYVYRIHHLPTNDPQLVAYLSGKYSALRLSALQTATTSFASTFAREAAFTAPQWATFLQRPQVHTFVAVAYPSATPPENQTLDTGDWIGCGTLIGPTPKAVYELLESGGPEIGSDDEEHKWQMTFVYNSPTHRGKGVGKKLISAAEDFTVEAAKSTGRQKTRSRVFIAPHNLVAKNLYSNFGFGDAGFCTLFEALLGNGDKDLVPADGGVAEAARFHNRGGVIMDKVVAV